MATKWILTVRIECAGDKEKDAANAFLKSMQLGPNNLAHKVKGKWSAEIPMTLDMLRKLQVLADTQPKLDITLNPRNKAHVGYLKLAKEKSKQLFDKAKYQSTAANRPKAKVDVTSMAKASAVTESRVK